MPTYTPDILTRCSDVGADKGSPVCRTPHSGQFGTRPEADENTLLLLLAAQRPLLCRSSLRARVLPHCHLPGRCGLAPAPAARARNCPAATGRLCSAEPLVVLVEWAQVWSVACVSPCCASLSAFELGALTRWSRRVVQWCGQCAEMTGATQEAAPCAGTTWAARQLLCPPHSTWRARCDKVRKIRS